MTWRQAGWAALCSPILLGLLLFVGVLVVCKLPMLYCERRRAVRHLPLAGLCYYLVAATAAALLLRLAWWEVSLLAGFAILGGEWLLPDPISFLLRPARSRAVVAAIEYVEQQAGPRVRYGLVSVIGTEPGRLLVSVAVDTDCRPLSRRFIAVGADGTVQALDFDAVAASHGNPPWL